MAKAPPDIRSLARAHTESAIKTLAGIMNQSDCPPAARVAASTALLDRGWGKPHQTQEITVTRRKATDLTDNDLAGYLTAGSSEGAVETEGDTQVVH